jgi:hypothetical protein
MPKQSESFAGLVGFRKCKYGFAMQPLVGFARRKALPQNSDGRLKLLELDVKL